MKVADEHDVACIDLPIAADHVQPLRVGFRRCIFARQNQRERKLQSPQGQVGHLARIASEDGLRYPAAVELGKQFGHPGHERGRHRSAIFVRAQNLAAAFLLLSLRERFERFENQLPWSKFHVAAHLIEIEPRVDQGSIKVKNNAAHWH